jgi:hypothetical protein
VIVGADDAEPILGMTALASAGVEFDPRSQRLKRLPSVRLKSAARRIAVQACSLAIDVHAIPFQRDAGPAR